MPTFRFNKLVRDALPKMYDELGQRIVHKKLQGGELLIALREKLIEEVAEIPIDSDDRNKIISEISDVEQVLHDLKAKLKISNDETEAARLAKFTKKGGFSEGIFVESIELSDNDEWVEYYRNEPAKYLELNEGMKNMGEKPQLETGTYQHYKGGIYEVIRLACHTETLEWYVVYESQERKKQGMSAIWVRPYGMFVSTVEIDGKTLPRFQKID